jgi:uncharacterized protein YjbI with pentapeptide repeats
VTAKQLLRAYKEGARQFCEINLDGAVLRGANLSGASFYNASMRNVDLSATMLTHVQLKGADLTGASLEHSFLNGGDLIGATFCGANLRRAYLIGSNMASANFSGATLRSANLSGCTMSEANCTDADMSFAVLGSTSLKGASLEGTKLTGAQLYGTHLVDLDVRSFCSARGVKHQSPSYLDSRTFMKSYPHRDLKQFAVDCGTPPIFVEFMIDSAAALAGSLTCKMLQSTFISYGTPDQRFASKLYEALKAHGVTAFYFPETAKVGEPIDDELHRQINSHDRVLLICSRRSLSRPAVITEIQHTLAREARDGGGKYLLPITLDNYVFEDWAVVEPQLAQRVREKIVADFTRARSSEKEFTAALNRVIIALKLPELPIRGLSQSQAA